MERALAYVAEKQKIFSELPFFQFLRDRSRSAAERLSFAPAGAPFIMAFADLNKYVLYVANSTDPQQELINVHSYEDSTHYEMYLGDLETLGKDRRMRFSEALQFLWSDELKHMRQACYVLTALLSSAPTSLRLVIVETIEAMGAVAFRTFTEVAEDYRAETGKALRYFGRPHEELESGHTMGTEGIEERLTRIALTDAELAKARELTDVVVRAFSSMMDDLHQYSRRALAERDAGLRAVAGDSLRV